MTDVEQVRGFGCRSVGDAADPGVECHGVRLMAYARSVATVVAISGEIDATNVDCVQRRVRRFLSVGTALILDLSGVESFGVQGLRALLAFDGECARAGVEWMLVASPAVGVMVRAGDGDGVLPAVGSVVEALRWLRDRSRERTLLHFVTRKANPAGP